MVSFVATAFHHIQSGMLNACSHTPFIVSGTVFLCEKCVVI
jgi:hypothetical protein